MTKATLALILSLTALAATTGQARAASDAECGNWLCLPAGYPSGAGCEPPYKAMLKRLKELKSPLPAYGDCASNNSGDIPAEYRMTAHDGIATYYQGAYHKGERCHWIHDAWEPWGCMGRNYWYVEVFDASGKQLGPTQYIAR